MSAVFGVVSHDPRRSVEADLAVITRALEHWGQATVRRIGEGAALGCVRLVASAPRAPQAVSAGGASGLVASARLDNRPELLQQLGLHGARASALDDAGLVAVAVARWGRSAPPRLLGDWAYARWDPVTRVLDLARDHFGSTGLYLARTPHFWAFAPSLPALLGLPGVDSRLDDLRLAQHLVTWPTDGSRTVYVGISRVPPAHTAVVQAGQVGLSQYWDLDDVPAVREADDRAYVDRFLELFSRAVEVRSESVDGVASTCSAGLDSSAVTALAADGLARRGRELLALTAVPAHPEVSRTSPHLFADERVLAATVARSRPNVVHELVDGAHWTPLAATDRALGIHAELPYGAANLPWMLGLLERVRERGCSVLLTGQLGNGGVSWAGDGRSALDRLLAAEPVTGLQQLFDAGRGLGPRAALRQQVLGPLRRRARHRLRATSVVRPPSYASTALLGRTGVERLRERAGDAVWQRPSVLADDRRLILLPGVTPIGALLRELGAAHGVEVRDPTSDVRLLEFCFGLPREQFRAGGRDRLLMRRALAQAGLPDVAWNVRRGQQWADVTHRLAADDEATTDAVDALQRSETASGFVDVGRLEREWRARATMAPPEALEWLRAVMIARFVSGEQD